MTTLSKPLVVVDIDNTTIDTALRKHSLLQAEGHKVEIDEVRSDFDLIKVFGAQHSISWQTFFEKLDLPETILAHRAKVIDGAPSALNELKQHGFAIHFLTARPLMAADATLQELVSSGIQVDRSDISFIEKAPDPGQYLSAVRDYKVAQLRKLRSTHAVVAFIGDRPEDAEAAADAGIPALLLASTLNYANAREVVSRNPIGGIAVNTWNEVVPAIERFRFGSELMHKLRDIFIAQYASWLRDIDEKSKTIVAIAAILVALCGSQLKDISSLSFGTSCLIAALASATLAILYAVQAFTSRLTSGVESSTPIVTTARQWFSLLVGWPKEWRYINRDPVHDYQLLKAAAVEEQMTRHYAFFHDAYKTYDPSAILNLRLFELKSTNYIKAYAERCASKLLMLSVILIFVWLFLDRVVPLIDLPPYFREHPSNAYLRLDANR